MIKSSNDIKKAWIDFFESKNHLYIDSKPLTPIDDPSLLWVNSGVATLKDYFSGIKKPKHNRLVNIQKCLRTNDIENVGLTSRHHTFFEMLGNFSIGDYFKKSAIYFAYEFLIDILKLDSKNLYITVFKDDMETYNLWKSLGIVEKNLFLLGKKTNFWDMGQGPCGPDTEIFYDRGSKYDGRGPELIENDIENDRYIELWNIVFSQYNNDGQNNYSELKIKNIDTGAGLERIACILQNGITNFDTDLFLPIIHELENIAQISYNPKNYFLKNPEQTQINKNFKIIADHMRSIVMTINEGIHPSNMSRGYVIRRLIRRAYKSGYDLGIKDAFLFKLVPITIQTLNDYHFNKDKIVNVIKEEENLFKITLKNGEKFLKKELKNSVIFLNSEIAFKLFDTYGFPIELTMELAAEKNIKVNKDEFDRLFEKHINISRGKNSQSMKIQISSFQILTNKISNFIGYEKLEEESKILMILDDNNELDSLNGKGYIITEKTPFYATSGGQTNDLGTINGFEVLDVIKDKNGNNIHLVDGNFQKNQIVKLVVDAKYRQKQEINHTANHFLFYALRKVLSPQIKQLGSYNDSHKIRFDFPCKEKPSDDDILKIENIVKELINANIEREYIETSIYNAKNMNATFLEGETYDDIVRVVKFANVIDLCGGTHIKNSSLIENFKVVNLEKKGANIFRIEAITLNENVDNFNKRSIFRLKNELNNQIKKNQNIKDSYDLDLNLNDLSQNEIISILKLKILTAQADYRKLLKQKNNDISIPNEIDKISINGKEFCLLFNLENIDLRKYAISLREKFTNTTFILSTTINNKNILVISSKTISSVDLFNDLIQKLGGSGGGNNILAQGTISNNESWKQTQNEIIKELDNITLKWEN